MALARRRFRRRVGGITQWFRGKVMGFVLIALLPLIVAVLGLLLTVLPDIYIYVNGGVLGAGTSLPSGATGVSAKLLITFIAFIFVIAVFVSGLRRISGVRL